MGTRPTFPHHYHVSAVSLFLHGNRVNQPLTTNRSRQLINIVFSFLRKLAVQCVIPLTRLSRVELDLIQRDQHHTISNCLCCRASRSQPTHRTTSFTRHHSLLFQIFSAITPWFSN